MATINPNWDTSWTTTSINSSSVTDGNSATTATISNDDKSSTEISVTIVYGSTVDEGIKVYVLRDVDGTNFEAVADTPWGFEMPSSVSGTHRRTFTVDGTRVSSFRIHLTNDSGASVTATVRYKQQTIDQV